MEITKQNFNDELENIITAIQESSFMAIDGEFTGLDIPGSRHIDPFDTPSERYTKLRNGSSDFLLIQFGLCTFKVDPDKQKYEAKPYNFYIFPRPYSRQSPDRRFLCQSSSMDFLISNGFNFNKLFKDGIPYLTKEQELRLVSELERKHAEANTQSPQDGGSGRKSTMPVPDEQKAFLKEICEKLQNFLDSDEEEPLKLPSCNAFQRKLIYQTIETEFPSVHIETKTGEKKERYMVISRTKNDQDRLQKALEKQALEKMELDIQVGFSKVIRAITQSGKLVVGHNMFLDVMHSVSHFQCDLPQDLDDFKAVVKSTFPRILDTKLMASTHPFKDHIQYTSLDEVKLTLQHSPFSPAQVATADGFTKYDDGGGAYHEAGYDAYITGCCFATMTKFLGTFQNPKDQFLLPTSHVIEPFVNKLFLMRIADIPYLNLNGPDLEVNRDHVFHITFPKEWRQSDLYSLFHPYGNIQISWLSDTSAYVGLHKKENAKTALKALSQEAGCFNVVSYTFHQRSKLMKWSAGAAMATSRHPAGMESNKRKPLDADSDMPPAKVKRHSLTNELPTYPAIPEEEEMEDVGEKLEDPKPDGASATAATTKSPQADIGRLKISASGNKKTGSKLEKKLFEEAETW